MKSSPYDLDSVEQVCRDHSVPFDRNTNEIRVSVEDGVILVVGNVPEENDTYFGFEDVPWHTHGEIILMTGGNTSISLAPDEFLFAYFTGEVLLVTETKDGVNVDRWFIHKDEGLELRYIKPGDTITVKSKAEPVGRANGFPLRGKP